MNKQNNIKTAWGRLSRAAAKAPPEPCGPPFGFSTRVIAHWRNAPQEVAWAMMEWFTWRGLAVAMLVLLGSAALSYDGISAVMANETAQVGDFINDLIEP